MNDRKQLRSLFSLCTGAALAGSLIATSAFGSDQPFKVSILTSSVIVAESHAEGACGEGKCGEGRCGGADKGAHTHSGPVTEGRCGEGKCGEGKCGDGDHGAHMHGKDNQGDSA